MKKLEGEKMREGLGVEVVGILLLLSSLAGLITVALSEDSISTVEVSPCNITCYKGEYITISIEANLVNQVSGWEIEFLNFSPRVLRLNSVTEGDLLSSVGTTSFNPGNIDNEEGTLTGCFCYTIQGEGAIGEGTLCILNFTALDIGVSMIGLHVELAYNGETVPCESFYGNVTVMINNGPKIVDLSPEIGFTGDSFTFYANVTDMDSVSGVWVEYWFGSSHNHLNESMEQLQNGTWTYTIDELPNSLLPLYYFISAVDEYGKWNRSDTMTISIKDNDLPIIHNIQLERLRQYSGDPFNISVSVSDNIGVENVTIEIHGPNSIIWNVSMEYYTNGLYYLNTSYGDIGVYTFKIIVEDTSHNSIESSHLTFYIYPRYDLDMSGEIDIKDITNVTGHYGETGPPRWIPQDMNLPYPDGEIDIKDITLVTSHYGETYPDLVIE